MRVAMTDFVGRSGRGLRHVVLGAAAALVSAHIVWATPNPLAGATELTQIANNGELVGVVQNGVQANATAASQLTQQINLVQGQLKAYQNMLQNTMNLPQTVWGDVTKSLRQLQSVMQQANTISMSGSQLSRMMSAGLMTDPLYRQSPLNQANYAQRYDQLSQDSQNALQGVLSANNVTMSDVANESSLIATAQAQGQTVQGQVQAIQVGNELAASTARQIAGLRSLTAAQNEQTSLFQKRWIADQDTNQALKVQTQSAAGSIPTLGTIDLMERSRNGMGN
jgi:type IV secretion system protein TrbJ